MNPDGQPREPHSRTQLWVRVLWCVVAAILVWQTLDMLLVLFVGLLLALFLRGLSDWISRHLRISPGLALGLVIAALAGLTALTVYLLAPEVSRQAANLQRELPQALERLRQQMQGSQLGQQLLHDLQAGGKSLLKMRAGLARSAGILYSTFGVVASVVVCFFVGLYVAASPNLYFRGAVRLFAPEQRSRAEHVLRVLGRTLQRWLLGRLLLMAINAVVTAVGLWLLGIPLALILGLISGLLNFIPNFGPMAAAIPAVLLAFLEGPSKALYVMLFYVGYQALDGYVLTPLVQKKTVALPAALTIAAQGVLGVLLGLMGVLLAVPIAATGLVLVKMLYLRQKLGEEVGLPGEEGGKA